MFIFVFSELWIFKLNLLLTFSDIYNPGSLSFILKSKKLRELYPNFDAKQYIRDLEHHIIYKHDESSFAGAISPYCFSSTMYPFLINGLKNIGGLKMSNIKKSAAELIGNTPLLEIEKYMGI